MTLLHSRSVLYSDELAAPPGLRGTALALWRAASGWAARAIDLHARVLRGCSPAEARELARILSDRLAHRRADLEAARDDLEEIRADGMVLFAGVNYSTACHAAFEYAEAVRAILKSAAGKTGDWDGGVHRAALELKARLPRPQNLGIRGLLARIRSEAVKLQAAAGDATSRTGTDRRPRASGVRAKGQGDVRAREKRRDN